MKTIRENVLVTIDECDYGVDITLFIEDDQFYTDSGDPGTQGAVWSEVNKITYYWTGQPIDITEGYDAICEAAHDKACDEFL